MSLNLSIPRFPTLAVSAGIALTALAVTGSASASPVQRGSHTCKPRAYPGEGYFTSLRVTNVSCAYGNRFMLAHYKCRTNNGKRLRGTCPRLLGFRCTEKRNSIPTQITSRVTCRRGTQRVIFTYDQRFE